MKLRNKRTRKVNEVLISAYGISGDVAVSVMDSNSKSGYTDLGRYKNLTELNEEWEDYKPVEPLIKDAKIRKAIRAWAEANNIEWVEVRDDGVVLVFLGQDFEQISFNPYKGIKEGSYTIAELCGEENENEES